MIQLEIKEKGKKKRTFVCEALPVTIGTRSYDTVILNDPEAKKGYCVLDQNKEGYWIGGTYHPDKVSINKKPFAGSPLSEQDVIRIGKTKITVLKIKGRQTWAETVTEMVDKQDRWARLRSWAVSCIKLFSIISILKALTPGKKTEILPVHKPNGRKQRYSKVLVWGCSLVLHSLLAMITLLITVTEQQLDEIIASFEMELIHEPVMRVEEAKKRDMHKTEITSDTDIEIEDIPAQDAMFEFDESDIELPEEPEHTGIAEHMNILSEINRNAHDWNSVLGVQSGGGAFSTRSSGSKKDALKRYGGTEATEEAVRAALEWFKRHQSPDGSWSMTSFGAECDHAPRCGGHAVAEDKAYPKWWDNCGTGFALLCFLGSGHTSEKGDFQDEVRAGILNLLTRQSFNGSFSGKGYYHDANYVHSIATIALCEAYGMTRNEKLKAPAQKAVDYIRARQNNFLGWDYDGKSNRNDTSVTGWQVMALKSAYTSGLEIGNSFDGAKRFFRKITPEVIESEIPILEDNCAYLFYRENKHQAHRNSTMTAISMLGRILTGDTPESKVIQAHANTLAAYPPRDYKNADLYRWYYGTLAMFQAGGSQWENWNEALKPLLVNTQCAGGCADGSWNPPKSWSGRIGGRVFSTAMACLSLEVYYRYSPLMLFSPSDKKDLNLREPVDIAGTVKVIHLPNHIKASVKSNGRSYKAFDQQVAEKLAGFHKQIVKIRCVVLKERSKLYIDGIENIELYNKTAAGTVAARKQTGEFGYPCLDYTDELQMGGNFGSFTPPGTDEPFAGFHHLGEDVWVPEGTAVRSIGDGTVMNAGFSPTIKDAALGVMYGFGNFVVIEHKLKQPVNGVTHVCSLYVHLSEKLTVNPGDKVYKGQPIGYVGRNMSQENGMYPEYLHFGIHKGRYHQLTETLKAHLEETAREKGMYIRLPENTKKEKYLTIDGRPGKWELVKGKIQGMMDEGNGTVHVMFEDGRTSVINTMMPVHGNVDERIPFWCRGYGTKEYLQEWVKPSTFIKLFQDDNAKQPNKGDKMVLNYMKKKAAKN